MKKKLSVLILVFISLSVTGQNSMFKALFMFNFAKYIEWPNNSNKNEFTIAIFGNDDVEVELKKLAETRKINSKKIIVKKITSSNAIPNADILFISSGNSSKIGDITSYFHEKPTLIVADKANMCKKGAHINYVIVDGKMKFEINKNNIKRNQLNVNPKLVSLGIEVQ